MILNDAIGLIVADGYGTRDVDVFKGIFPDRPDACLVVGEYSGRGGFDLFGEAGPSIIFPRIQLKVRGVPNVYDAPRQKLEAVQQRWAERGGFTSTSNQRYQALNPIGNVFPMGQDRNRRWMFAINFEFVVDKLRTT
jgi:Bacteriophage minor capsid protein